MRGCGNVVMGPGSRFVLGTPALPAEYRLSDIVPPLLQEGPPDSRERLFARKRAGFQGIRPGMSERLSSRASG